MRKSTIGSICLPGKVPDRKYWMIQKKVHDGTDGIKKKMYSSPLLAAHTVMNKVTGALLFILPMTISIIDLKYSSIIACTVATFAAFQEGHYIRTGKG